MSPEVVIRPAREQDLDQLVGLCQLHAEFEQSSYDTTHKRAKLGLHLFQPNPPLHCLVAEQGDSLLGYATCMRQFSTWDAEFYLYLDCIFLTEASRGMGLGEQLMEGIKAIGRRLECSHIQWQTPDFNTRAMKFYERLGATSKSKERFFLQLSALPHDA